MAIANFAQSMQGLSTAVDIITFTESQSYLGVKLFPVQRFLLKIVYNMPLSDDISDAPIVIKDKFNETIIGIFESEKDFLQYLYDNDFINSMDFDPHLIEINLIVGRRGTKTTLSSIITCFTLYQMLNNDSPHEYLGVIKQSEIGVAICSNNKDNAARQLREVSAFVYGSDWFKPYLVSKEAAAEGFFLKTNEQIKNPDMKVGKLYVSVFAASPSVRGSSNIVVIMDEYAHFIDSEVSTKSKPLDKILYEALTPSVSGFSTKEGDPMGRAIIITSPNGKKGEVWKKKKTSKNDRSTLFLNVPSWWINPTIAPAFLKKMYMESEQSFWQEFGAKFVEKESNWIINFQKFRSMRDISLSNSINNGVQGKRYYLGVDLALSGDGTAMSVVSFTPHRERKLDDEGDVTLITNEGVYAVEYCWYKLPARGEILQPSEIFSEIENIKNHYKIVKAAFDQWSYDLFSEYMKDKNITLPKEKISSTQETNSNMARFFKTLMNEGCLILPNDDDLFYEIEALRESISGKYIKVENTAGHDDRFTSILRALWICKMDPLKAEIEKLKISNQRGYDAFKNTHHKPLQQMRRRK